jgi:hypothetical protein
MQPGRLVETNFTLSSKVKKDLYIIKDCYFTRRDIFVTYNYTRLLQKTIYFFIYIKGRECST